MSLRRRARTIRAEEEGVPAADELRFVPPPAYLKVLQKVRAAFDVPGANEGFELVRVIPGFPPSSRAAAQRAHDKGVPDGSGRALQNYVFKSVYLQEEVRSAAFQLSIPAHKLQRGRVCLGLQMCETLVSILQQPGLSVGNWLQPPQVGPRPFKQTCTGDVARTKPDCEKCPFREDARPSPECSACKHRMMLNIRGIAQ